MEAVIERCCGLDVHQATVWLDLGLTVEAIGLSPGLREPTATRGPHSYWANVAGPARQRAGRRIDLTSVLEPIEERTLASLDSTMQGRVGQLSADERANVFALRAGSATGLFRTQASGWIHPRELIHSANFMLGPNPWVHVISRRDGWAYVEAANADAARSAMVSMYTIQKPIDETLEEVEEGGRAILERANGPGDRLQSFVAGPSPTDARFGGQTRYYRRPDQPDIWTVAIWQLDRFWVRDGDLVRLDQSVVDQYAAQAPSGGSP